MSHNTISNDATTIFNLKFEFWVNVIQCDKGRVKDQDDDLRYCLSFHLRVLFPENSHQV
ncbi:hypothetical protein WN55_02261 [Dufourea novaeangliae]|uniref:Uncharacterized protein n=1 Tax=Dufourea novaeangliae TaxID=178035 RepID=A0A154PG21_DUFNO|nr:hypothetical protein WN55_02261 [Dufourea novaeangliae]